MNSRMRRMAAVAASAVTTVGLAAAAGPASARAEQASASRGAAAVIRVDNWGCGSVPAFVSSKDGAFTGQGISIRSGPSTTCTRYGLGYEGDILKVWCQVASGGLNWVYLNDRTTGVRGWSDAHYVTWSGSLAGCVH
jgi:hypothetical protein